MAEFNPAFTPPVATATTELWYAETETGAATQVFGVQGIPNPDTPPDDITYKTLESTEGFSAPGTKPATTIEIELILYKEQYESLKALDRTALWWYVKYPESYGIIRKWQGKFVLYLSDITLDDMCKCRIKLYRDTKPTDVETIPTT